MALPAKTAYTIEQFDAFTRLPENANRLFEYIGGEIIEVPSNPYSSALASTISFHIKLHLREANLAGHVTGEAGGYMVSGERYAPNVAFISKSRQPELMKEGYNPSLPELAVEVVSPTDSESALRIKVVNYLATGTLVWVVKPETQTVEVYTPGQPVRVLGIADTLDGGEVLSNFRLTVQTIFES